VLTMVVVVVAAAHDALSPAGAIVDQARVVFGLQFAEYSVARQLRVRHFRHTVRAGGRVVRHRLAHRRNVRHRPRYLKNTTTLRFSFTTN